VSLQEEVPVAGLGDAAVDDGPGDCYPADQTKKGLPRLAIVVVGKRHNTRFYPTTEQEG
jgi:hypothetical protein